MHRTQVLLEDHQYLALREKARQEGKSMGQLIREFVELGLCPPATASGRSRRALASLKGVIDDPDFDARDHDNVLYTKS